MAFPTQSRFVIIGALRGQASRRRDLRHAEPTARAVSMLSRRRGQAAPGVEQPISVELRLLQDNATPRDGSGHA